MRKTLATFIGIKATLAMAFAVAVLLPAAIQAMLSHRMGYSTFLIAIFAMITAAWSMVVERAWKAFRRHRHAAPAGSI